MHSIKFLSTIAQLQIYPSFSVNSAFYVLYPSRCEYFAPSTFILLPYLLLMYRWTQRLPTFYSNTFKLISFFIILGDISMYWLRATRRRPRVVRVSGLSHHWRVRFELRSSSLWHCVNIRQRTFQTSSLKLHETMKHGMTMKNNTNVWDEAHYARQATQTQASEIRLITHAKLCQI